MKFTAVETMATSLEVFFFLKKYHLKQYGGQICQCLVVMKPCGHSILKGSEMQQWENVANSICSEVHRVLQENLLLPKK